MKQISIFKHFNISIFQGGGAGGGKGKTHINLGHGRADKRIKLNVKVAEQV